jgi:hypothetical protein
MGREKSSDSNIEHYKIDDGIRLTIEKRTSSIIDDWHRRGFNGKLDLKNLIASIYMQGCLDGYEMRDRQMKDKEKNGNQQ